MLSGWMASVSLVCGACVCVRVYVLTLTLSQPPSTIYDDSFWPVRTHDMSVLSYLWIHEVLHRNYQTLIERKFNFNTDSHRAESNELQLSKPDSLTVRPANSSRKNWIHGLSVPYVENQQHNHMTGLGSDYICPDSSVKRRIKPQRNLFFTLWHSSFYYWANYPGFNRTAAILLDLYSSNKLGISKFPNHTRISAQIMVFVAYDK